MWSHDQPRLHEKPHTVENSRLAMGAGLPKSSS